MHISLNVPPQHFSQIEGFDWVIATLWYRHSVVGLLSSCMKAKFQLFVQIVSHSTLECFWTWHLPVIESNSLSSVHESSICSKASPNHHPSTTVLYSFGFSPNTVQCIMGKPPLWSNLFKEHCFKRLLVYSDATFTNLFLLQPFQTSPTFSASF